MPALFAVMLRLLWRWGNPLPRLVDGLPQWQQVAARFVHLAFYAQMFAVPVTGWLMSSAGGYPLPFFGLFEVPDLVATNEFMFRLWIAVHRWLAYALALFLGLHAGAALHHHFSLRDDAAPPCCPAPEHALRVRFRAPGPPAPAQRATASLAAATPPRGPFAASLAAA